jgi:hypothetical protein|tara:strand:+ start:81 stop:260 length:180 start_codon:yes stop_codon:yes gene_type:complete
MSYIDNIDFSEVDVDVDEDGKIFIVENSSNNTLGGDTGIDADFGMEEELIETKLFKKYG